MTVGELICVLEEDTIVTILNKDSETQEESTVVTINSKYRERLNQEILLLEVNGIRAHDMPRPMPGLTPPPLPSITIITLDAEINEGGTGETGGNGGYELPVATATTLGGVKIGDGVDVTEDGTISPSKASDEDVDEMLKELYGEE